MPDAVEAGGKHIIPDLINAPKECINVKLKSYGINPNLEVDHFAKPKWLESKINYVKNNSFRFASDPFAL